MNPSELEAQKRKAPAAENHTGQRIVISTKNIENNWRECKPLSRVLARLRCAEILWMLAQIGGGLR
jgi:hypothetical protein